MNIVDSSGWLEFFANGKNADIFAKWIEKTEELIVPSITIAEVFKRTLQQRGEPPALQAAAHMMQGKIIELDANLAMSAAKLGCELKLPLADSIILATAYHCRAALWTQDEDFKSIKGVHYVPKR